MEHRWYRRLCAPLTVTLYTSEGVVLESCRVNNISLGGILVDVNENNRILDGELENKLIKVELQERQFFATLPSLVLRSNGRSLALMFTKQYSGLREFLSRLRGQQDNEKSILVTERKQA